MLVLPPKSLILHDFNIFIAILNSSDKPNQVDEVDCLITCVKACIAAIGIAISLLIDFLNETKISSDVSDIISDLWCDIAQSKPIRFDVGRAR